MTSAPTIWNRKLRRELKRYYGNTCAWTGCNTSTKLEFAHIEPTSLSGMSRGSKERMRDVRDNPHAYTLLCKAHHYIYDSQIYKQTFICSQLVV